MSHITNYKFLLSVLIFISVNGFGHSGGTDKNGCHAGSQSYHCHNEKKAQSRSFDTKEIITGTITHVRDGDTFEVDGVPIRLAALDCPEKNTQEGRFASKVAKRYKGSTAVCELTGATTYDRLVGYCKVNGVDFGRMMMNQSECTVWEKYDVWNRY